ncbi:MprA protease, GlyGly-CTERM protein-sorting domain-containing form [Ralstonia soli]|uniref:MprA protease, GlyGly-CTERM protein-sorting domain-containing form n=1 Tax=Ralstonia soli TaxID=2953896 RepID=A0ABT1AP56_9RALS|nr:MprA protease, GlyGly-CTERM protein-sorting domain-containing form [Ralstonia soli]MCO5400014.1 MprA protease, GlyGly-CTERM protein-sorting domain-containing form [Ralstonia soli]
MTPSSFRLKSWLRAGASVACLAWAMGTPPATAATSQPQYTGDLIIKWRDDTSGTRKPLSASEASNRLLSVAQAAGSTLQVKRTLATSAQLMGTGLTDAASIQAAADKIAQDARVAYVVPDRILQPSAVPNDPRFGAQTSLAAPAAVPGGINVASAWDVTLGSPSIVVAVVDTGYTDHPDLSSKILPGYNFISDPVRAGNTSGRGPDAHDMGDGVTSASQYPSLSCPTSGVTYPQYSSWHGTEVASVLAAATNNGVGIAGVGWNTPIVPVRVSGRCGALLSDTVDGMLWAGGIAVPGAPANANPARVVNVSLGSTGQCSAAEQDAVNQLAARGAIVVAASGNEAAQNADAPGNCAGAIAVTAHVDTGENASYANVGPQVAISAPGGGCPNSQPSCLTPSTINADSNDGQYSPGNPIVRPASLTDVVAGTSFSTPEVAGTIALMLSVQPQLSNAQVLAGLQQTARPHPAGTYCTTHPGVCGAGLLDAAGAVHYAQQATPAGIGNGSSGSGGSGSGGGGGGGVIPLASAALLLALGLACSRRRPLHR